MRASYKFQLQSSAILWPWVRAVIQYKYSHPQVSLARESFVLLNVPFLPLNPHARTYFMLQQEPQDVRNFI